MLLYSRPNPGARLETCRLPPPRRRRPAARRREAARAEADLLPGHPGPPEGREPRPRRPDALPRRGGRRDRAVPAQRLGRIERAVAPRRGTGDKRREKPRRHLRQARRPPPPRRPAQSPLPDRLGLYGRSRLQLREGAADGPPRLVLRPRRIDLRRSRPTARNGRPGSDGASFPRAGRSPPTSIISAANRPAWPTSSTASPSAARNCASSAATFAALRCGSPCSATGSSPPTSSPTRSLRSSPPRTISGATEARPISSPWRRSASFLPAFPTTAPAAPTPSRSPRPAPSSSSRRSASSPTRTCIPGCRSRSAECRRRTRRRIIGSARASTTISPPRCCCGPGSGRLADWAADKNETLLRYGQSPAKTANGAEIAERFWTDSAVQQVSYDRGHLLAARLDSEIAARSAGRQSLESVLRTQRRAAEGSPELAVALFRKTLRDETGNRPRPGPRALRPPRRDAAPARRPARRLRPRWSPSGARPSPAATTPTRPAAATESSPGSIREGPAYAAGLRDGMQLVRREAGKIGDASVELAYRVTESGVERVISYMPEGKAEFEVQRLELTAAGPRPKPPAGPASAALHELHRRGSCCSARASSARSSPSPPSGSAPM